MPFTLDASVRLRQSRDEHRDVSVVWVGDQPQRGGDQVLHVRHDTPTDGR